MVIPAHRPRRIAPPVRLNRRLDANGGPAITPPFEASLARAMVDLGRYARRFVPSEADAQDLVQEVCVRALEQREKFSHGANPAPWLRRIMRNLHVDQLRRGWREVQLIGNGDALAQPPGEGPPLWRFVSDEDVSNAVAALPTPFRVPYLRSLENVPYGQIARELAIPRSTVGTRLVRARTAIRRFLMERAVAGAAAAAAS
jgi:RNA polymerase sigma-70 factor (ECF subfamily)